MYLDVVSLLLRFSIATMSIEIVFVNEDNVPQPPSIAALKNHAGSQTHIES